MNSLGSEASLERSRFLSSAWIGVDAGPATPRFARSDKGLFSGAAIARPVISGLPAATLSAGRTVAALPSSLLFAERIDLPRGASRGIVRSQLDVRLPVPVEECLVLTGPRSGGEGGSVMAYAVTREAFRSFLADFRSRLGFEPERIVPAAEVLWRKVAASLPADATCAIHLHASGASWTLLAGDGKSLYATLSVPADDLVSVSRNSAILSLRLGKPISSFTLSGEKAGLELVAALSRTVPPPPCEAKVVAGAADFLALALAEDGASRDLSCEGNFRDEDFPHPGATRRLFRRAFSFGAFLLVLALAVLFLASSEFSRSRRAVAEARDRLTEVARGLAGRPLPVTGAAALEMARNEFDQRLNPTVEAFRGNAAFDSIALPLELALTRNLTFSSIVLDGDRVRFSGKAVTEDDLAIWRRRAREAGLALAVETSPSDDGAGLLFEATQFFQEAPR